MELPLNPRTPVRTLPARRPVGSLFTQVFTTLAVGAPLLLVATAFTVDTNAAGRAHVVVAGSERIVLVLAAGLLARAVYALGERIGRLQGGPD